MLHLAWHDSSGARGSVIVSKFPFRIGRSASSDLCLGVSAVWDSHAVISHNANSGEFHIASAGEALLRINGQPARDATLTPGDKLQVGAAEILVTLSPARSRSLTVPEAVFWAIFFLMLALEGLLAVIGAR